MTKIFFEQFLNFIRILKIFYEIKHTEKKWIFFYENELILRDCKQESIIQKVRKTSVKAAKRSHEFFVKSF